MVKKPGYIGTRHDVAIADLICTPDVVFEMETKKHPSRHELPPPCGSGMVPIATSSTMTDTTPCSPTTVGATRVLSHRATSLSNRSVLMENRSVGNVSADRTQS